MARKNSTKKRVDALSSRIKAARAEAALKGKKPSSAEDIFMLATAYAAPVNMAFEEAGLNFEDPGDWTKLTICLAAVVYGKRKRADGVPTWSPEKYELLLSDIAQIKAAHPNDDESECCERLLKKKYNVHKVSTLRRQLQNAKRWKEIKEKLIALAKKGKGPLDILKAERKLRKRHSDNPNLPPDH
jgi:hypothetical protein